MKTEYLYLLLTISKTASQLETERGISFVSKLLSSIESPLKKVGLKLKERDLKSLF